MAEDLLAVYTSTAAPNGRDLQIIGEGDCVLRGAKVRVEGGDIRLHLKGVRLLACCGVLLSDRAEAVVEDCVISGEISARGVEAHDVATELTLRRCSITGFELGLVTRSGAKCSVIDCEISHCRSSGIQAEGLHSTISMCGCYIHHNTCGVALGPGVEAHSTTNHITQCKHAFRTSPECHVHGE